MSSIDERERRNSYSLAPDFLKDLLTVDLFVISRTSINRGSLNRGSTVLTQRYFCAIYGYAGKEEELLLVNDL